MNESLVSVIVPVYNVSEYLDECISSIVKQDYRDIEIILVDDGSSDSSGDICDKWGRIDSRIKVIHKSNGGLSSARNTGLDCSSGSWVRFVDGDDVLPEKSVGRLISEVDDSVDLVCGKFKEFVCTINAKDIAIGIPLVLDWRSAMAEMLYQRHVTSSVCDKLFRKGLFDEVRFTEGLLYEDLECMSRLLLHCRKVVTIAEVVYYYRKRPRSILATFNRKRTDVLDITESICNRIGLDLPESLRRAADDRRLSANFNIFLLLNKHGMESDERSRRCWSTIRKLRWRSLTDRNVRIKNKIGVLLSYLGQRLFGRLSFLT